MTSGAIRRNRLQSLIVAFETRGVSRRHRLEEPGGRCKIIGRRFADRCLPDRCACRELWQGRCGHVAYCAVIEFRLIVRQLSKICIHEMRDRDIIASRLLACYHILMNAVRKNNVEVMRARTHRKRKERSTSRTRVRMTSRTERRLITDKEILTMTTRTRDVPRELGDIRKSASRKPVRRRDFMA